MLLVSLLPVSRPGKRAYVPVNPSLLLGHAVKLPDDTLILFLGITSTIYPVIVFICLATLIHPKRSNRMQEFQLQYIPSYTGTSVHASLESYNKW